MAITLSEKLALLAFNDEKGVPYDRAGTALPHALAATLVFDLQAAGAVELDGSSGDANATVTATDQAPDDPLLGGAWHTIAEAKTRKVKDWIGRPAHLGKNVPHAVYERLVDRGVLEDEGKSRIFHRERYDELDHQPHDELIAGLNASLDGDRLATADELLLLALLPVCRLTTAVLPHRDRRATEARIDELLASDDDASGDVATQVARATAREVAAIAAVAVAAATASATG